MTVTFFIYTNAQVPTNGLVFRQDFTGNFNVTSTATATSDVNTSTLTSDEFYNGSRAGNFDLGQTLEYPFSTNTHLMTGIPSPYETSISAKVYVDPTWLSGLATAQYVTFLQNGNSYMRLFKTATNLLLQCGFYQSGGIYVGTQVISDEFLSGWHTVTMTHSAGVVNIYKDGSHSAMINLSNLPLSYNSATEKLVLGKPNSANNNFKGKLDKVLIYNRVLTAAEVLAIQNEQPSFISTRATVTNINTSYIDYTLRANGSTTTSLIRYGTSPGALTNVKTGSVNITGIVDTALGESLTSLIPGTTYYYQIEATNSFGITISPIYAFTAGAVVKFPFDTNYKSVGDSYTLTPTSVLPTFVTNRFGEANKAMYLNYSHLQVNIPILPQNNESRTVSFWAKRVNVNMQHSIYAWGGTNVRGCFGGWINTSNSYITNLWGAGYDYSFPIGTATNWDHYVIVYSSIGTISQYVNGVLQGTVNYTGATLLTSASTLHIGSYTNATGAINDVYLDDFMVFNTALTSLQVTDLHNSQNLSTQNFQTKNLKASIYPNPASDNFSIEMDNEVKSVEVFSLQGQKVLTSKNKNVNVSGLSKGMYLVRIEDVDNAVATKKLMVE